MPIKIMSYNLFEGAHESYENLVSFINQAHVDVLCLQEVNGWQDNNFKQLTDFASQCGFPFFVFGDSNTEFKLATFSRFRITSQAVYTDGFWHSVIRTRLTFGTQEITVFNLHLNPQWEGPRIKEVNKLLGFIEPATPCLLLGDFNSISEQDAYPTSLLSELRHHSITKFGKDKLEFTVTRILESTGFIDMAAYLHVPTKTVPSAFNKDKNHEVPLRLDYVFATKPIAQRVKSIEVIKNKLTDRISDHYPLLATIEL